jgi:hypothetical protein
MKFRLLVAAAVVATTLVAVAPIVAHHSFSSEYDSSKTLVLKGKMVLFEWTNPHSWVHVEVTNPDGTKTIWRGETLPVNLLYRSGWTKPMIEAMVKKGEIVTLRGSAAKDGSNHVFAQGVTRESDGAAILGQQTPPAN